MNKEQEENYNKKYSHLSIPHKLPNHVAIIMDGNRRWSVENDFPYIEGHKNALDRIEELIEYSATLGIEYLTLWAWSTKNWKRSKDFINDIISLFRMQLKDDALFDRAVRKGAKLHHIGKWDGFPKDVIDRVEERLLIEPEEKKIDVNLAVGYEGRDEMVRVIKKIIDEETKSKDVTQDLVEKHLDTAGQPDVDLLIRTGGDFRTSGYLIWQAADAELYFTDTYMPGFTVDEFHKSLVEYAGRERRLGGDSKKY